jgi:hypothetical protein
MSNMRETCRSSEMVAGVAQAEGHQQFEAFEMSVASSARATTGKIKNGMRGEGAPSIIYNNNSNICVAL